MMRSLTLAASLLVLAGCPATAPVIPDGRVCHLIWDKDLQTSVGYCILQSNVSDAIEIPADELFKKDYSCVSPAYLDKLNTFRQRVSQWADQHCGGK